MSSPFCKRQTAAKVCLMDPCYKDGKGHAEGTGWTGFESWKVKDINAPLGLELCRITLIEADLYFNKKYTYFWRGINSLSPSPASPCYHSSQGSCFFSLRWGSAFFKDGKGFFLWRTQSKEVLLFPSPSSKIVSAICEGSALTTPLPEALQYQLPLLHSNWYGREFKSEINKPLKAKSVIYNCSALELLRILQD